MIGRVRWVLLAVALAGTLVSCGGRAGDPVPEELSPSALAGRDLVQDKGCVACHGSNGRGGAGPAWTGLVGSVRALEDGTEVVADRAYLSRAVADPQFEQVTGYNILMPQVPLTEPEVQAIVDYIETLS